jgi:hypothetical protein
MLSPFDCGYVVVLLSDIQNLVQYQIQEYLIFDIFFRMKTGQYLVHVLEYYFNDGFVVTAQKSHKGFF